MPRKLRISRDEYSQIIDNASAVRAFLESGRFGFIVEYIKNTMESSREAILKNTVTDVTEQVTVSEKVTKLFFTPKKVQEDELKALYKWTTKFFEDMQRIADMEKEVERKIGLGELEIDDDIR